MFSLFSDFSLPTKQKGKGWDLPAPVWLGVSPAMLMKSRWCCPSGLGNSLTLHSNCCCRLASEPTLEAASPTLRPGC